MDSKSISEPYNKIQNWMHTSPCVSETDINKDKTINFDDLQFENDLNVPSKPVREIPNELIGQNNYDCKRLFEYICPKIKKYGYCRNKKKCSSLHDFPYAWEEQLLEQPLNNFLSFYEDVKTKHENHLWKLLFPVVVKRSRESELYNKLSNLVVDVMEKDIDQDKTTFILMIVEALQEMGLTFTSSVEVIFNKAKLHPELKNSLADILLGIIVEKLTNLEDTWFVISMLTKDRNNVDTGIIQDIISIALKEPIDQHMCTKIYKDILVNVEDTQINSIFHTVLGRYIEALQTFNLIKEATTLQKRWKNSETVQNETQVKESLPSLDFNFVPSTNLNIVPEIRLLPSQYNPNIPPPVIIGSVQRPYEQPLVKGLDRMQQNRPGSVPIACNVPQSDEVNRSPMSDKVTLGQPYSLPGCSRNDQNTDNFKLQTQNWEKRKKTAPENLSTKNQKISPNQVGINNGYVGERTKTAFENANHSQTIYNSDGFRSNYAFVKTNSSSSASDEHFPVFKESSFLLNPLKEIHDIEMGPNSPARPNLRLKPGVLNKFSSTSNPPNYYFQQNSNILDLEAIRSAYTSENTSEIVRGIYSCHPNGINEYVRVVLDVLLNENHVIPTFYNNICDALVGK